MELEAISLPRIIFCWALEFDKSEFTRLLILERKINWESIERAGDNAKTPEDAIAYEKPYRHRIWTNKSSHNS